MLLSKHGMNLRRIYDPPAGEGLSYARQKPVDTVMPQILQDITFILIVAVLFTAPLYWINRPKKKRGDDTGRQPLAGLAGLARRKTPRAD